MEILARISQNSSKNKEEVFTRLYRYLLRPDIYYEAYRNLYANSGAATKGVNEDTADGFSEAKINRIIKSLETETYQPKPARRTYIQKASGKMRPLGIPTFTDKLVQEVLRLVLQAVYEPVFLNCSHGFRPNRSCHTALAQAKQELSGARWFIEGDIKGCFDHIDHTVLVGLVNRKIKDARLIKLLHKFLKAGYMEQNTFFKSAEGTPQGGILSPLLANVYLTAFDWTVGRMYQHPRQQTAYICSDRARLLYQGVIPKYLVRYADDWVILTNSEQEAHRFLHWLQKYFTHRLKIELSEEKTVITDMRQAPVNFLGFSFKVRQTAYQPDKPRREIAMSYPNPQKLQKAIRKLCDGVKAVRTCSNDSYRAVQIETVNAQIVGIAEHYKHVLCSEAYHKIDYAVNKCAYKVFKRIYGKSVKDHVIPLENLSNRPTRHAGHKDTALAMQIHGQWIGFTKAYLTHAAHGGHSFHQKITPYTAEGRELYRRKAKKSAPKDRPPLYDGTNLLELSAKKPIYNFEYYMNREYAFNRDKGKCRCCHINLNPGHYHCHHINPKLPINQINKVQNLAWVCENCHKAIHGKAAPSYAVGQVKDKIERFQKQL